MDRILSAWTIPQLFASACILIGVAFGLAYPGAVYPGLRFTQYTFFLTAAAICVVHVASTPKKSIQRRITLQIAVVALIGKLAFELCT